MKTTVSISTFPSRAKIHFCQIYVAPWEFIFRQNCAILTVKIKLAHIARPARLILAKIYSSDKITAAITWVFDSKHVTLIKNNEKAISWEYHRFCNTKHKTVKFRENQHIQKSVATKISARFLQISQTHWPPARKTIFPKIPIFLKFLFPMNPGRTQKNSPPPLCTAWIEGPYHEGKVREK